MTELRYAIRFTLATLLLLGAGYHLFLWSVARTAFASEAEGSLARDDDGTLVGSVLLAQRFTQPRYFHPRPSAVDYNAASTGGSNYGPSNPDHLSAVRTRLESFAQLARVPAERIPSELVTTSGAGLDPHISPRAADLQIARVAAARDVAAERIRDIVRAHTLGRTFGLLGQERVNVLELNLALDRAFGRGYDEQPLKH